MSVILVNQRSEEFMRGCSKITSGIIEEKVGSVYRHYVLRIMKIRQEYRLTVSRETPQILKYDGQLVWVDLSTADSTADIYHLFDPHVSHVYKFMVEFSKPRFGKVYRFFVQDFEEQERTIRINCLYHTYIQKAQLFRDFRVYGNKMVAVQDVVKHVGVWRNEVPSLKEETQEFIYPPLEFLDHDFEFKEIIVPECFFKKGRKEDV